MSRGKNEYVTPAATVYGVYIFHLIRYSSACGFILFCLWGLTPLSAIFQLYHDDQL
jgi:hypothetical protein